VARPGTVFCFINAWFGVYLLLAAGTMLVRNNQNYARYYTIAQDRKDAMIEADYWTRETPHTDKSEIAGYPAVDMRRRCGSGSSPSARPSRPCSQWSPLPR